MSRAISEIAQEIEQVWGNVSPHAYPYLKAMKQLNTITDRYYEDSAQSIVNYFLSNARYWKGEDAKRIKAELKSL
tara:strand:- start:48318 stop:48542 length:225 start_codon:yes stop_codon:yes gene_type:complete